MGADGLLARIGHRGQTGRGDRLVATVTDPDGNVLGLIQDR
jgi:hypothetical protein